MTQRWIWQSTAWPQFDWQNKHVQASLRACHHRLGVLSGKTSSASNTQQSLDTLLANILASSAIEGELLNAESVRSSLANHLGVNNEQPYPVSDQSEGLADLMLDALTNLTAPLTEERLNQWHHWLFPQNSRPMTHSLRVGELRGNTPMQVVSGRLDKQKVHFEAPPRSELETGLTEFLDWFNQTAKDNSLDPLIRAAISHFWFITLHPFDDGNGRLTRALTDLALAQGDNHSVRLYAMSVAILEHRNSYYQALEAAQAYPEDLDDVSRSAIIPETSPNKSQQNKLDLTQWIKWFLETLLISIDESITTIDRTLTKTAFWQRFNETQLNPEQRKVLNRLLDGGAKGFEQGISAAQYQKVAKVSKATATRHLADLLEKGCVEKMPGRGRSTRYKSAL
jgi:Fic family protein